MVTKRYIPIAEALSHSVRECLRFVKFINRFRREPRLIWYRGKVDDNGNRVPELVGEHSFQLSIFAWYIRDRYLPHLNREKLMMYAQVHDLPEIYAGDTPAFPDPNGVIKANLTHADKEEREQKARLRIEREWEGAFPSMIQALRDYEAQEDEESRFIYALDKFLAEMNIYEDNDYTDITLGVSRQMKEDYKKPRIGKHPFLAELYEEFCRFCKVREEYGFAPKKKTGAT